MSRRDVEYESPTELSTGEGRRPPLESKPQTVAAGIPAVLSSLSYTSKESGLLKGTKTLLRANQDGGVDCPSCAWPDPEKRSPFEFCENGAKALADETTIKKVPTSLFTDSSVEELSRHSDYWLNGLGRLTEPLYLPEGESHYRPIAWDTAFELIAQRIADLDDPNRAVFYTSGRASNEAAFLYGTMARMIGTNNLPDCSNMCHESSGTAMSETIGIGKGTVTLEDFDRTQLILVIGQNPGTNHPRMLSALQSAKEKGARIVSINPLAEAGLSHFKNPQDFMNPKRALSALFGSGTQLADKHLPVRLGGDLALLQGVCKALLSWDADGREVLDHSFIQEKTQGFDALRESLRELDWKVLESSSGISKSDILDLASWVAESERLICCWAMGVTQHLDSVSTITQIINLLLLRGCIGKPGAGACPVRGHSNVQGDRTMGIWERPKPEFLERLGREFDFPPPFEHGLDVVDSIHAMMEDKVDVFISLGGNFLSATPDTAKVAEGLAKCQLTVQISTKLNRSHLVTGKEALLLPCLGRTDMDLQESGPQFVTVENSMGKVHRSRGVLQPGSERLKSEVAIITGIAEKLAVCGQVDWSELRGDYARIRDRIEAVIPGFEAYNQRIQDKGGFYLPNGPREGHFPTASGKAHFSVAQTPIERKSPEELYLMTLRSHDQFNTVVYDYGDRYRGIERSRRVVFCNSEDLERLGFRAGDLVDMVSTYDDQERWVRGFTLIAYPIPRDCCAAYFPEANPLIPSEHRDPKSGCPASKKVAIRLVAPSA